MKSFELKYSFVIENRINIFKIIIICVTFLSVSVQLVYQCSKGISKMYYLGCFFLLKCLSHHRAKEATTL